MKHTLQILLMIVSVIALNSCEDYITFRVFEFDNSKTTATNITENSVTLSCQVIQAEKGNFGINNKNRYNLYMVIADYPEYFEGVTTSSGWKAYYCLSTFVINGTYSADFTGLRPNTTYYYVPIVPTDPYDDWSFDHSSSIGESIIQGEVKSFTTPKHMASLEEFYGTYTMTYYDTSDELNLHTSSNVYIVPDQDGEPCITGLPPYGFTAFGLWDTDNYCLEMSVYYSIDESVTIDDKKCYCMFTPIYYDRVSGDAYWTWWNDGYSYINFEWVSDGIIKMTTSPKKGENGLSSNAFTWRYVDASTEDLMGNSHFYYDVTLTKTSSNYAPARGPIHAPKKNALGGKIR